MRFWHRRADDIDEEIATHVAMATADRIARGESPEAARQAVMREFGNVPLVRETTRSMWGGEWLEHAAQDLRYAWRQMRRAPGFSLMVVATLAIGLGATAAMFTVVNRVLLQVLPYRDASRLVLLQAEGRRGEKWNTPWLDVQAWREKARSFQEIALTRSDFAESFLERDTEVQRVDRAWVSPNMFHMLGVSPAIGKGFTIAPGADPIAGDPGDVVILSDTVWRESFGGDRAILGRVVRISGQSFTVVGVMPRGFAFPVRANQPQVWTAFKLGNDDRSREGRPPTYIPIARLRDGVSIAQAEAEMKAIQPEVAKLHKDSEQRFVVDTVSVTRYGSTLVRADVRRSLLALFGASALLWLISCVNVTGLMLARGTVRQREIAVRGALGAGRLRIVHQLMIEGLMLSLGAAVLGLLLAMALLKVFSHGLVTQLNIKGAMPDPRAIAALLLLTFLSAVLAALWPAVSSARASIEPALRQGGAQAGYSRSRHRVQMMLVVTQISLSLVLLVCCGLLLRTIYSLRHAPLGFRTDNIVVGNMIAPMYRLEGRDVIAALYNPLLERVKAMPGVDAATLMTDVPLGSNFRLNFSFGLQGNSPEEIRRRDLIAQARIVGPEGQKVFGFRMLRGRFFNEQDTAGSPGVIVVNRAFVNRYYQSGDPDKAIGQRLVNFSKDRPGTIVGVLDDTRQVSVAEQSQPEIEVCLPQLVPGGRFYIPASQGRMSLVVRSSLPLSVIVPRIKDLLRAASPELVNTKFTTMTQIVEDTYGNQQIVSRLLIVFGGSAFLLCLSGIYGLLSQLVTQRTREIGVRVALGASRGRVVGMVLRQAGRMLLAGAVVGLALAWFASRLVSSFLYGVKAHDLLTMAAVALLLAASGFAAAWLPASRAARIDPVEALRAE